MLCSYCSLESNATISTVGIVGIVAGSLLFTIVCLFGICFGIYFCVKAKKPCTKTGPSSVLESSSVYESSIKLNYSAVENCDSTGSDSEREERFDHYQPPAAPLPHNEETD